MKVKIYVLLTVAVLISCGSDPGKRYQSILKDYRDGKATPVEVIEAAIEAKQGVILKNAKAGKNSLFRVEGSSVTFWQGGAAGECSLPEKTIVRDVLLQGDHCYVNAGRTLLVYRGGSRMKQGISLPGEIPIDAVEAWPGGLLLLGGKTLYRYNKITSETEPLLDKTFSSPDKNISLGYLMRAGDLVAIAAGYAGHYHIAVINPNTGKVLVDKIKAASRCFYLDDGKLFYVSGGSGKWQITRFDTITGRKKTLFTSENIINIALFSPGFALEDSNGISLYDYKGVSVALPLKGHLAGSIKDAVVLGAGGGKTVMVSFQKLMSELHALKKDHPQLFTGFSKPRN